MNQTRTRCPKNRRDARNAKRNAEDAKRNATRRARASSSSKYERTNERTTGSARASTMGRDDRPHARGGLYNVSNTCYLNSVLQVRRRRRRHRTKRRRTLHRSRIHSFCFFLCVCVARATDGTMRRLTPTVLMTGRRRPNDANARSCRRRVPSSGSFSCVRRRCDTSGRSRITSWVMRRRSVSRLGCVENTIVGERRRLDWRRRRRRMGTETETRRDRWTRGMRF